jgi:hypothetical protein
MKNQLAIKKMPLGERPREKLVLQGSAALSDLELLAVLLGSGNKGMPVLKLCREMLALAHGDLRELAALHPDKLCRLKGIGQAKAVMLHAAFELGARRIERTAQTIVISNARQMEGLVRPYLSHLLPNRYLLVLMNRRKEFLATAELQVGSRGFPDLNDLAGLLLESGIGGFGLVRTDLKETEGFLLAEKSFLKDIVATAQMLQMYFTGLVIGKCDLL